LFSGPGLLAGMAHVVGRFGPSFLAAFSMKLNESPETARSEQPTPLKVGRHLCVGLKVATNERMDCGGLVRAQAIVHCVHQVAAELSMR
jgi:hypothetical protein